MQWIEIVGPPERLGEVHPEDLPPYLVPVRAAADALYSMGLYSGRVGRDYVLEVIELAERELASAKEALQGGLAS